VSDTTPVAGGAAPAEPAGERSGEGRGVPARPTPLPPPRRQDSVPPGGTGTVVPERGARPAPPRAPLTRPATPVRGRRARLTLKRLDPWSVFVTTLLLSLFVAVMTIVASVVLFVVLDALGVPERVNEAVTDVNGSGPLLTMGRFVGFGSLIAAANVVLMTLLATVLSMLYNLSTALTGGLEVTLSERD